MLIAIAVAYVQPIRAYREAKADVAERQARVVRLERAAVALEQHLARAGTSTFVEQEARWLGLVRPGERLFIVTGIDEWRKRDARRAVGGARLR
ncbi:MAG: septum formation initiator family protein [Gaiellaceae bacterium]